MPISREVSTVPRRSRVSPRAMSDPAKAMFCPGPTGRVTARPCPASNRVCSIITTASRRAGSAHRLRWACVARRHRQLWLDAACDRLVVDGKPGRRVIEGGRDIRARGPRSRRRPSGRRAARRRRGDRLSEDAADQPVQRQALRAKGPEGKAARKREMASSRESTVRNWSWTTAGLVVMAARKVRGAGWRTAGRRRRRLRWRDRSPPRHRRRAGLRG